MQRKRVIVCLDVKEGRVVRAEGNALDVGDPVTLAQRFQEGGADELIFLDISSSAEGRRLLLDIVGRTAQSVFMPLTVGGGISEVADIELALRAGADKVSINTAGVRRPELIGEASVRFGKQCVIATIDARLEKRQIELVARTEGAPSQAQAATRDDSWFRVFTHGGRTATELDAIAWSRQCATLGAGEIMVTSIDQDRSRSGYDLELTARIVEAVNIPVIANGGAGSPEHIRDVFLLAGADAAAASDMLYDGTTTVIEVKRILAEAGVPVRPADERKTPDPAQ